MSYREIVITSNPCLVVEFWRSSSLIQCSTIDLCQYVYWVYSIGISVGDSQGDDVTSQACTMLYVQYLEYYYWRDGLHSCNCQVPTGWLYPLKTTVTWIRKMLVFWTELRVTCQPARLENLAARRPVITKLIALCTLEERDGFVCTVWD